MTTNTETTETNTNINEGRLGSMNDISNIQAIKARALRSAAVEAEHKLSKNQKDLDTYTNELNLAGVPDDEVLFQLTTSELMDSLMAVDYNDEYEYDPETLADICIQCSNVFGNKKSLIQVLREYGNDIPEAPEPDSEEEKIWLKSLKKQQGTLDTVPDIPDVDTLTDTLTDTE